MSTTALLLVLVSACMHAGWNFFGKKMHPSLELFLPAQVAGMILLLPVGLRFISFLPAIPPEVWKLATAAGFFQALYFLGLAGAYRHGDLSIAYPIARSSPVLVVMVMTFILGRGDEISRQAVSGILIVVGASFFLPMKRWGDLKIGNYFNLMSVCALMAAIGTTGYSIMDDEALRILRMPGVLGADMTVTAISFLYLFFEVSSTVFWMSMVYLVSRLFFTGRSRHGDAGHTAPANGLRNRIFFSALMGLMIYSTYGLVLVSMAFAVNVSYIVAFRQVSLPIGVLLGLIILKEEGSWIRMLAVLTMVLGLVLVGLG